VAPAQAGRTPDAVAVLFELANEVNRTGAAQLAGLLKQLGGILGLLERPGTDFLRGDLPSGWTVERIASLIAARNAARKTKNFAEADRIRQELLDAGILLEDTPQGTTWRRA